MIPLSLLPLHNGQAANKCSCISPVFFLNSYLPAETIPSHFTVELDVVNKIVELIMPSLSYYASRYQKDNKVKPRDLFSDKSTFTTEVILPLLVDFKAYEGVPMYFSKAGMWSTINKIGLIYCQAAAIISDKAKSLNDRIPTDEWGSFVKATFTNVINSGKFSGYYIIPVRALSSDIFWNGGFSFNLHSSNLITIDTNKLVYLHEIYSKYDKSPDYLILTVSKDGSVKFSFSYDFSQSGGAKALYSFASDVHDKFPDFDYYRYTGKSDPFYYPLTCYSK